eukprot:CAMPEP_0184357658 /NCGR_PEP_ID=MMETSP1089-20130417/110063_1 /TAXON_ID=38269 ORGANISM="Gloeochaete wittrockiana, Strain SAG46.84" /NCGR_SAMPLE_ID=MMETSP1089 /ASSEMBLY_ACC=CAM_ASM_000445 /LENGTH=522 /DNA_ID=CAMNT_0026695547 /DNA_START=127 /DNA_END=1695 /DNA_ORIENTATION=+
METCRPFFVVTTYTQYRRHNAVLSSSNLSLNKIFLQKDMRNSRSNSRAFLAGRTFVAGRQRLKKSVDPPATFIICEAAAVRERGGGFSILTFIGRHILAPIQNFFRTFIPREPRVVDLYPPEQLADADSRFIDVSGVRVHYKYASGALGDNVVPLVKDDHNVAPAAVLLHGFGASVFSWREVIAPLAQLFQGNVVAFDRPGFGLTSRPLPNGRGHVQCSKEPGKPCKRGCGRYCQLYSYKFAGELTVDLLNTLGTKEKPILIGHSAGGLLAVDLCSRFPDKFKALILLSPAVFVGIVPGPTAASVSPASYEPSEDHKAAHSSEKGPGAGGAPLIFSVAASSYMSALINTIANGFKSLFKTLKTWAAEVRFNLTMWFLQTSLAAWILGKLLSQAGPEGVKASFFDVNKCTPAVLEGYKKPLQCWDSSRAFAELVRATLAGGFWGTDDGSTVFDRLRRITIPTLVIAGQNDRLVPANNSILVQKSITDAQLSVIPECGHLPHEEKTELVMDIISRFLIRFVHDN